MTENGFKTVSNRLKKLGITRIGVARNIAPIAVIGIKYENMELHLLKPDDELYDSCLNVFLYLKKKEKEIADKVRQEIFIEKL